MASDARNLPSRTAVDAFLREVAAAPVPATAGSIGRLVFALDATASRQPTWDRACHIQAEMFAEAASGGGGATGGRYGRVGLRARRHGRPPADLGPCLPYPGGDVRRSRVGRRARHSD